MTARNRTFLIASAAILILGLGGAFAAYLLQHRAATGADLPAEVRYVPDNAMLVAYADVRGLMASELHRELMAAMPAPSRRGRRLMNEFAGIDLEKDVTRVLVFLEPGPAPDANTNADAAPRRPPPGMMLVQGSFNQGSIEAFIKEHGGAIETYNGRSIAVRKGETEEVAIGFVRPDLIAVGYATLVRRALDGPAQKDISANEDMTRLMRDASGGTAWVVGHFDAVRRTMRFPAGPAGAQVPPVRLMSVRADVNGGVKARIRAEADDEAAAEQLREVVRGFIALARMQSGSHPQFESALKSVELTGSDRSVQLSVSLSPEALRSLVPRPNPQQ